MRSSRTRAAGRGRCGRPTVRFPRPSGKETRMFRALLWKEVRACWIPGLLALLGHSWIAFSLGRDFENSILREWDVYDGSRGPWHTPFGNDLWTSLGMLCMFLGITLGVTQSIAESIQGTSPFLV